LKKERKKTEHVQGDHGVWQKREREKKDQKMLAFRTRVGGEGEETGEAMGLRIKAGHKARPPSGLFQKKGGNDRGKLKKRKLLYVGEIPRTIQGPTRK